MAVSGRKMRKVGFTTLGASLAACLMAAAVAISASAGPFEDAFAANARGDYATALRLYRSRADQGDADAQVFLGDMYCEGRGVPQNYAEALTWFRKAADRGNALAQVRLGFAFESGHGVPRNDAEALKWYRKAGDQGDAFAQFLLGRKYHQGQGVPKNYVEAVNWLRKAADQDQGNAFAQIYLGSMYLKGEGVPQNYSEAMKWFRKSADQGAADAQSALGDMYATGQGVPRDDAEAVEWYRKAAGHGNAPAEYHLGLMYAGGRGVPQDYAEATQWFRKAASQGHATAQLNLGALYSDGQGVPQSYLQAHMWFNIAASNPTSEQEGRNLAVRNRDLVAGKMLPGQIAQAQAMAEQCVRSNYAECGSPQAARQENKVAPPSAPQNLSTGTGFFISTNGHLVTNAHVVDGCQTVRSSRGGALRKVAADTESDLALYLASERPDAFAHLRGGRGPRAGEPVITVGFPLSGLLSSDPIVTTGIISALSGLRNDRRTIQITAPVQPGNSGAPVLGENGGVVGVVVSTLNAKKVADAVGEIPQNVNFAVSLGTLQSFLNANGVPYLLDDSQATRSPADIAAEASRYTVLIECLR